MSGLWNSTASSRDRPIREFTTESKNAGSSSLSCDHNNSLCIASGQVRMH